MSWRRGPTTLPTHRLVSPVLASCLQSWKTELGTYCLVYVLPGMVVAAAGFVLGVVYNVELWTVQRDRAKPRRSSERSSWHRDHSLQSTGYMGATGRSGWRTRTGIGAGVKVANDNAPICLHEFLQQHDLRGILPCVTCCVYSINSLRGYNRASWFLEL